VQLLYILKYKSKTIGQFLLSESGGWTYTPVSKSASSCHCGSKRSELYRQRSAVAGLAVVCETQYIFSRPKGMMSLYHSVLGEEHPTLYHSFRPHLSFCCMFTRKRRRSTNVFQF